MKTIHEEAMEMARCIEAASQGVDFVEISGEPLQHLIRILRQCALELLEQREPKHS